MSNKLISIIITTYSRPDNLCRAIESVLNQTYSPIEIIVVDDNGLGTENQIRTEKLLSYYIEGSKITYIKHEVNRNGSVARNTGVKAAKGFYIGLLDDDDEFAPDKIAIQIDTLINAQLRDPLCCGCYCNTEVHHKNGKISYRNNPKEQDITSSLLLGYSQFNTSTFISTRASYLDITGFDERFLRHQDWEFFIRYLSRYHMVLPPNPQPLIIKHLSPNAISRDPIRLIEYKEFFLKEMKSYIDVLEKSNQIYYRQYMDLSLGLYGYGFWRKAYFYYKKAATYYPVKMNDRLDVLRYTIIYIKRKLKNYEKI